jgi:arylsulfatase A-like enzyme
MGLYPPTGGYGRFDKRNALPVWLHDAGYYTAHLGKFLNGYGDQEPADVPPGWSDWHATVDFSTYRMWGYTLNENGHMRTYGRAYHQDPRLYQTDVLAAKAARIVRRNAGGPKPLFLSVNFLAPHHEARSIQRHTHWLVRPAPRHRGAFASARLGPSASFNEADMSDKPLFLRRRTHPFTRGDVEAIRRDARARRAALLSADEGVARVISALRRTGELDRTYIIFTSDNGYMQGQHRVRSGKMLPYDPSTQVPLLVRGPGIPARQVSGELVGNIDLAPTLLELAGARAGKVVDGRSLMPFARNPALRTKRAILHETGGRRYAGPPEQDELNIRRPIRRVMSYRAIRTRRWLYIRWRDGSRELYDLVKDPDEMQSLHAGRAHRHVRRVLARKLGFLATCAGESCR